MRLLHYRFWVLQFIIFCLFPNSLLYSQTYFNVRFGYSAPNNADAAKSLLENDGGYLVAGMTGAYYIGVANVSSNGDIFWFKTWGKPYAQYWLGNPGSFIKTDDAGYAMFGTYKDTFVTDAALMMKFNDELDTTWTQIYYDTINNPPYVYYYFFQGLQESNSQYTACGVKKPYGNPSFVWLIHLNEDGTILWEKSFGSGTGYYQGHSIVKTNDGGYAIGGFLFYIGNDNSGDPIVIKTDSLGNQQWMKNLGGGFRDYKAMISLDIDGNIIIGTNYAYSMSGDDPKSKINIIKLNNQGNILWNKKYGNILQYNYLLNVRALEDGNIVAVGQSYDPSPEAFIKGWILKVNSDGDSTWYRDYKLLLGYYSENTLRDIIQTTDLGYIACGDLFPVEPDTGSQDAWVIKLDSIGCPYPECDTTVGLVEIPYAGTEELVIYPNPAESLLQASGFKLQAKGRLMIYDMYGRKVGEVEIPQGWDQVRIDVAGFRNGIYVAVLYSDNQIVGRKKFVVAW